MRNYNAVLQGKYHARQAKEAKSFLFEFLVNTGRVEESKIICFCLLRASSVFASFLNLQTQKLKMQNFAKR